MKRYFTLSLTLFVYSALNVLTYLFLGLITGNPEFSGIFSITYPLQLIFGIIIFSLVAIFVDNYISFMNMDAGIYRNFTLMAIGQLFLGFVCNIVTEKLYC